MRSTRVVRIMLIPPLTGGLVLYEAAVALAALWLNATRYYEGPVVLRLVSGHSLHRMDLGIIGVALLPWILLMLAVALRRGTGRMSSAARRAARS